VTLNSPLPTVPPATVPYDGAHGAGCALVSVLLGLTQSLTVFGINNNLPALQGALGATAAEASWLSTAYFATALSAVVLMTRLRLQIGIERFATWSIAAFAAVSLWSFLAPSLATAIAARAVLGLAAAPLITLAVLYMMEAVPPALAPVGAVLGFATLQFGSPLGRIVAQPLFDAAPGVGLPMFDLALALVGVAAINVVPMRPTPRQKVFNAGDLPAFALYATGLALLCVVVTQGRLRWWTDTPWLGTCLCLGIACLGAYAILDLWRDRPLIDLRWLAGPPMPWLLVAIVLFRIGLSEQPTGAIGLMNVLGLSNDQMRVLFGWVTLGTALGFGAVVAALALRRLRPARRR
jgi:MFS family permease